MQTREEQTCSRAVCWDHSDQQGQQVSSTAVAVDFELSRNIFSFHVWGQVIKSRFYPAPKDDGGSFHQAPWDVTQVHTKIFAYHLVGSVCR